MATPEETKTFDPEALHAKYLAERDKRLRADGMDQYIELKGAFAELDQDPYVEPGFTRDAIVEELEVVIVGGGFGGMLAGAELHKLGVTHVRIIEKAGDFGGTWYWNRYPGAACDVESYVYLPLLEETGYIPTEKYAKAPEIFAYCQLVGRKFDLYKGALFQTLVTGTQWDEAKKRWLVTTNRGDKLYSRFLVIAGGILHKAKLPGVPGILDFKGHAFHTSRWDYDYTGGDGYGGMDKLKDKRVGYIGTGATGIQAIPHLAETAKELYVFQRTPSGVGRRDNRPTDPEWAKSLKPGWQAERMDNFTAVVSGHPVNEDLVDDGWTEMLAIDEATRKAAPEDAANLRQMADYRAMESIRGRVDAIVKDPATAEALKPWYNQMCKRPCFHDEYLQAFNRPSVHLVDTDGKGVDKITETGVVVGGKEYELDLLIYGSGFEVTTAYVRRLGFDIIGRDGASIGERWGAGDIGTLHGILARDFPNLLMFNTSQGGWAINFLHTTQEIAKQAAWIINYCETHGIAVIEPSATAQEDWWNVILQHLMANANFTMECTPGYFNAEGSRDIRMMKAAPFGGGALGYIEELRKWRASGDMPGVEVTYLKETAEA